MEIVYIVVAYLGDHDVDVSIVVLSIRPVHLLWATPASVCLVYILPLLVEFLMLHPASLFSVSLLIECHN